MSLQAEDIEFIKTHIAEWLADQSLARPPAVYEVELRERLVRVEETLKHQLILMERGFQLMEKRFEAMDKRFEELREDMNQRFEAVDKRFEAMDKRFAELREDMDKRFEAVDKRFEAMDKRFEAMDKRFEHLTRRTDRFMFWSLGLTFTAFLGVIAAVRYLIQAQAG